MKQKYSLVRDTEKNILSIREYAELDKEILSLLCEESYPDEKIRAAVSQGQQNLIAVIRTHNMYPPGIYAEKIADAIIEIYAENGDPSAELFFDDRELFSGHLHEGISIDVDDDVDADEAAVEVDDLLEDDLEDDFDEDTNIVSNLKSSLKVSDEDSSDLDSTP